MIPRNLYPFFETVFESQPEDVLPSNDTISAVSVVTVISPLFCIRKPYSSFHIITPDSETAPTQDLKIDPSVLDKEEYILV